jgi:hypothetical protein
VYHTCGVHRLQAFRQPGRQRQHGRSMQRPAVADLIGQRGRVDVRRGQPRHRSVQIRVQHGRDEGSAHLPGRGHVGPEPGIHGHVGRDNGHRDAFPIGRTAQEQPTTVELPEQFVRPHRARLVSLQRRCHSDPTHPKLAVRAIPANVSGNAVLRCGLYQCTRERTVPAALRGPLATTACPRSYWPSQHLTASRGNS